MNKYRLPTNAYNRTYDKKVQEEDIKNALVGQKPKEIIDIIIDEDKMLESEEHQKGRKE